MQFPHGLTLDQKFAYALALAQERRDARKAKGAKPECRDKPVVSKTGRVVKPATIPCGSVCRQKQNCRITKKQLDAVRRQMPGASRREVAEAIKKAMAKKREGMGTKGALYEGTKGARAKQGRERIEARKRKGEKKSKSTPDTSPIGPDMEQRMTPRQRTEKIKSPDGLVVGSYDRGPDQERYGDGTNARIVEEWRIRKLSGDEHSAFSHGDRKKGPFATERRMFREASDGRYRESEWQVIDLTENEDAAFDRIPDKEYLTPDEDPRLEDYQSQKKAEREEASRKLKEEDSARNLRQDRNRRWKETHVAAQRKKTKGKEGTINVVLQEKDGSDVTRMPIQGTIYGEAWGVHKNPTPTFDDPSPYVMTHVGTGLRVTNANTLAELRDLASVFVHEIELGKDGAAPTPDQLKQMRQIVDAYRNFDVEPPDFVDLEAGPRLRQPRKAKKPRKDSYLSEGYFGLNPTPFHHPLWDLMGY